MALRNKKRRSSTLLIPPPEAFELAHHRRTSNAESLRIDIRSSCNVPIQCRNSPFLPKDSRKTLRQSKAMQLCVHIPIGGVHLLQCYDDGLECSKFQMVKTKRCKRLLSKKRAQRRCIIAAGRQPSALYSRCKSNDLFSYAKGFDRY